MNYYNHHIGDYARDTAHLTWLEDCAYRRMLDLYYASERPLPLNRDGLYRLLRARTKEERKAVDIVLQEFFVEGETGWRQKRCDGEIERAQDRILTARENGKKGGRARVAKEPSGIPAGNPVGSAQTTQGQALQSPNTKHQPPIPLPSGNGRSPKSDPVKEEIWKSGRALLEGQGVDSKAAGDFLGRLCKDHGTLMVVEAVRDAVRVSPAEAKGWLVARCQQRKPNAQEALEANNRAIVEEALKHGTH